MAGILINNVVAVKFVAPTAVINVSPAFVSDSLSLKRQVSSQNVQRWEIQTNLEPSNSSTDFFVHNVINGYDNVFEIQMPQPYRGKSSNKNTNVSSFTCSGTTAAGSSSLSANLNGSLFAGDFIQFSNHDKVYMVKDGYIANGLITLNIFPSLRAQVTNGVTIKTGKNVKMKCRYNVDFTSGISYTDGIVSDPGTVRFVEAL